MNPLQEEHLSDEQFGSLLAGSPPSAEAASHLQQCKLCRRELESVGVAVHELSVVSSQWAEAAATRKIGTPSRWERTLGGRVPWAAGFSVTALAGVLAFGLSLHHHTEAVPTHPTVVAAAPSSSALAEDNRLLLSISQELSYRADTPVLAASASAQENEHGKRATHVDAVVN